MGLGWNLTERSKYPRPAQQLMRVYTIMSNNPRAFRTTVGASLQQFDFLMRNVEKVYSEIERARLDRPGRKRTVCAGRLFSLHLWGMVLMALMYCRISPLKTLCGAWNWWENMMAHAG